MTDTTAPRTAAGPLEGIDLRLPLHCPVCGHRVRVVSTDEGTGHYEPIEDDARAEAEAVEPLLALVRAAQELTTAAVPPDALMNPDLDGPGMNGHRNLYDWWTYRCAPAVRTARDALAALPESIRTAAK